MMRATVQSTRYRRSTPGMAMAQAAKKKRARVTKDRITEVSAELFYYKGYHTTTLDDVARALAVTKPSLYYHFPSKEAILLACIETATNDLLKAVADRDPSTRDGRARVESFLYCYLHLICHNLGVSLVLSDDRLMTPKGTAVYNRQRRKVTRLLEEFMAQGVADESIVVDDTKLTTYAIFGLFNSVAHWNFEFKSEHVEEIYTQFMNIVFNGIGKKRVRKPAR